MLRLLCLLLPLGTGFPVSGSPVRGVVGRSVTLPCTYPVTRHSDVTSMCWGRGRCPHSGCRNGILRTDGWNVTQSESTRYRMKGDISGGDVSLTIEDVRTSDEGTYCCRVAIPGWFNDEKHEQTLEVVTGPKTPTLTYSTSAGAYKGSTAGYIDQTQVPVSVGTLSQGFNAQQPEESDSSPRTTVKPNLSSKHSQINIQDTLSKTNTTIYVVVPVLVLTLTVLVAVFYIKRLKTNKNGECIRFRQEVGVGLLLPDLDVSVCSDSSVWRMLLLDSYLFMVGLQRSSKEEDDGQVRRALIGPYRK